MLRIENLSVSYGPHLVLDNLSLALPLHQVHGLAGMNGAGKTTLLHAMAGFVKSTSGKISYETSALKRTDLSFLATENFFYSYITGREYLELFEVPVSSTGIEEWNRIFSLPLNQQVEGYSSGMKKKLAIIGVLRQNKPLVVLDEPFNGLDLEASRMLSLIIARLKEQGSTVIITSHILGSLTGICDQIHLLHNGKIRFSRDKMHFDLLEKEIFGEFDQEHEALVRDIFQKNQNNYTV